MNIYLAGPMRGIKDFNFPEFMRNAELLRSAGHSVFNPAERDLSVHGAASLKTATGDETEVAKNLNMDPKAFARDCFLADTEYICKHADAIYLMPGWETSKGAIAEKALGEALGLEIWYLHNDPEDSRWISISKRNSV